MKNTFFVLFLSVLSFFIPNTLVFATSFNAINQNLFNINNSISNLNESINRNSAAITKSISDAQLQQKLDSLDQNCVNQLTSYINGEDKYIKSANKEIENLRSNYTSTHDMSFPSAAHELSNQLNYYYNLIDRQSKVYKQWVIDNCLNYKAPLKSNDQTCVDQLGQNYKWTGTMNTAGGPNCWCKDGYSNINNECVITPITLKKSDYQKCQDNYGSKSNWDGTLNDNGGLNCICVSGYQWNSGQTQCIIIPKTETKVTALITKKTPEVKSVQAEPKDSKPSVLSEKDQKVINSPIVSDTNSVVSVEKEQVKHKNLWSRIKGLFGF